MSDSENIEISFVSGGVELLDDVGPLWMELRDFHARIGGAFAAQIAARTFDDRAASWRRANQRGEELLVDLAWAGQSVVGYCATIIDEAGKKGTIDSLFVVEARRRQGVGGRLMRRALQWLDDNGVDERYIEVLVGNDRALTFYARHGFAPRTILMKQLRN